MENKNFNTTLQKPNGLRQGINFTSMVEQNLRLLNTEMSTFYIILTVLIVLFIGVLFITYRRDKKSKHEKAFLLKEVNSLKRENNILNKNKGTNENTIYKSQISFEEELSKNKENSFNLNSGNTLTKEKQAIEEKSDNHLYYEIPDILNTKSQQKIGRKKKNCKVKSNNRRFGEKPVSNRAENNLNNFFENTKNASGEKSIKSLNNIQVTEEKIYESIAKNSGLRSEPSVYSSLGDLSFDSITYSHLSNSKQSLPDYLNTNNIKQNLTTTFKAQNQTNANKDSCVYDTFKNDIKEGNKRRESKEKNVYLELSENFFRLSKKGLQRGRYVSRKSEDAGVAREHFWKDPEYTAQTERTQWGSDSSDENYFDSVESFRRY